MCKLSSLIYTKIKVEEPCQPKTISQCINCQEYGHTNTYYRYLLLHVRCCKYLLSFGCLNSRDTSPKCAFCHGNHPASYKGCFFYKKKNTNRKKPAPSNVFLSDNVWFKTRNIQSSHPSHFTSFYHHSPHARSQSYAYVTSNQSNNTIPNVPAAPAAGFNKIISSFLEDFKFIINTLTTITTY